MYLKNFFTLIRAVCISWMHENCPPMGGESKYVEIGVITLGSSAEVKIKSRLMIIQYLKLSCNYILTYSVF